MMLQLANKHTGAEPQVGQPKRLTAARYLSVANKMSGRIRATDKLASYQPGALSDLAADGELARPRARAAPAAAS